MANNIPGDKRVPILLSSIGASTYSLLSDLLAPETPSDKSLAEISAALRKHFEPKRAVIAERYHFYKRDQSVGENITDFNAVLRKLATHSNFGVHLAEALRDRLVCGLQQETIQRRLLSETELMGKSSRPCTGCGHPGHWRETCKFKDAVCHACGKVGHITLACRTTRVKRLLLHLLQLLVDSRKIFTSSYT